MKKISIFVKNINAFQLLVNIYTSIFIFTMINREFLPFGFDLRYAELLIAVIILFLNFSSKKIHRNPKTNDSLGKALILFYAFALLSNISWFWNGLEISTKHFINENILLLNVFLGILVFYYNRQRLNFFVINYTAIFSCCVLSFSILAVHQGMTLAQIYGSPDAEYIYTGNALAPQINLFGENFRCAGYASDPNYATILLLIGIVCALKTLQSKTLKILLFAFFTLTIGFSFSKTIIISVIPCIFYTLFIWKTDIKTQTKLILNCFFILALIITAFMIPFIANALPALPDTLSTRLDMWGAASELFIMSPIIGSGITSFRSFYAINWWYVQAHSTYWQIFSELGIIGIALYYRIVSKALDDNTKSPLNFFLICVFLIWIITCESIALPFSVFIYYLTSIERKKPSYKSDKKRALFIINSLKNGGAERVCSNMIQTMAKDYNIDVITLQPSMNNIAAETAISQHKVYNIKSEHKIFKLIKTVSFIPFANLFIRAQELDYGNYNLITSHLPFSNIFTRCLYINRSAIYVMHTSMTNYCFCKPKYFQKLINTILNKRKVVAVSKGLKNELINTYLLSPKYVRTIYNPINLDSIKKEMQAPIAMSNKFILNVGRLSLNEKRQDRMIKVFEKGKFYQDYHLVFCGDGEDREKIQNLATKTICADKIHFLGYQDNIYAWMHHSSALVSTSDHEAFPMNLVEALACNTKVISSDCKYGPNEILTDDFAEFLVEPNDNIDQYIDKINLAFKSYPKGTVPIIKKCTPENIITQYITFYKENL